MFELKEWRILIDKDGTPCISWSNGAFGEMQVSPDSREILVTNEGIVFTWIARKQILHYKCLFSNLSYEVPPTLLDTPIGKSGQVKRAKSHVLTFIYEFASIVLTNKCQVILNKVPLDLEALLTKYDAFRGQLEGLDYERIASNMNLKKRGS